MDGFDLDDTLASVNLAQARFKPMADIFAAAPVIYTPSSAFVVITGRPHATAAERRATLTWLHEHQPHFSGIHYVDAHSAQAIADAKGALIKRLKLASYTDNNRNVLKALATLETGARLYAMDGGKRVRYVAVDRAALARTWAPTLR